MNLLVRCCLGFETASDMISLNKQLQIELLAIQARTHFHSAKAGSTHGTQLIHDSNETENTSVLEEVMQV